MKKLEVGMTVYYITEAWSPYRYRIAECKVRTLPYGRYKEYCLNEGGHLYYSQRQRIYTSFEEAVEVATKITDRYERVWNTKLIREWESASK